MNPPQLAGLARPLPPQIVLTSRIVWVALVAGQMIFAIVITVVRSQQPAAESAFPAAMMTTIAAVMLIGGAVIGPVLRKLIIRRDANDQRFGAQFMSATIISMALLEGPSLFALVIVFLSGSWWPAGLITAVAIALQLMLFPRATA